MLTSTLNLPHQYLADNKLQHSFIILTNWSAGPRRLSNESIWLYFCLVVGFRPRFHSVLSRPLCNCLVQKINQGTDVLTHNCLPPLLALCVLKHVCRRLIIFDQQSQDKNRCGQLAVGSRHSPLRLQIPFLTHRSSIGRFTRESAIGQMVAMENRTCIARLVQFKVIAVAMQPRFHHIQHLNEVTIVGQRCTEGHQCKMASVSKCVLLLQQNVCIFKVVMKVSDE